MLVKKLNDPVRILSGTRYFGGVCYFMIYKKSNYQNCEICGVELLKKRIYIAACNKEHNNIVLANKKSAKLLVAEKNKCIFCEAIFSKLYKNQTYCSVKCRQEFNHLKFLSFKKDSFSIYHRDSFRCVYCGKSSIEDGIKLNVDHITPISKGGENSINNLITSCSNCNFCKSDLILSMSIDDRIRLIVSQRNKKLTNVQMDSLLKHVKHIETYR